MHRFRTPELFLGCFLTVAVFAAGMLFVQWPYPHQPAYQISAPAAQAESKEKQAESNPAGWSDWLLKDAAGFFTFGLVAVGVGQALLFFIQLSLMRKGMTDSTIGIRAARRSAVATVAQARVARDSAIKLQRPYIFVFGVTEFKPAQTAFSIDYTVANYGTIPAILEEVFVGFVTSDTTAPELPSRIGDDHDLCTSPILEAGGVRRSLTSIVPTGMDSKAPVNISDDAGGWYPARSEPDWVVPPGHEVFFRVVVRYRGPFSSGHETSATWLCERGRKRLIQRGGEDYNYNR